MVTSTDAFARPPPLETIPAWNDCRSPVRRSTATVYRVLNWCRGQVAYARGRRARLPLELGELNGSTRAAVEALFCKFDESIAAAEQAVSQREAMGPWEALRATGYATPA